MIRSDFASQLSSSSQADIPCAAACNRIPRRRDNYRLREHPNCKKGIGSNGFGNYLGHAPNAEQSISANAATSFLLLDLFSWRGWV